MVTQQQIKSQIDQKEAYRSFPKGSPLSCTAAQQIAAGEVS